MLTHTAVASMESDKSCDEGEYHVMDKQKTKTASYKSQIITEALAQPTESELIDVL
jgi:hypothetical protein